MIDLDLEPLVQVSQALDSQDDTQLRRAVDIVKKTLNVPLMERLLDVLRTELKQWRLDAQDEYNKVARTKRENFHVASASLDKAAIAEACIEEALWHVNGGEFRLAQASFKSAMAADPSKTLLCSWACAQLDLLKGDWLLVTSATERSFAATAARLDEPYATELLHSHALALWKQQMWDSVAMVLLHTADTPCAPQLWPWMDAEGVAIMCVCSSLASLDRETLGFMLFGDLPMRAVFAEFPYLSNVATAFIEVDISRFWNEWHELEKAASKTRGWWLLETQLQQLAGHLKQLLVHDFLSVRSQCTFEILMEAMSVSSVLELAAEIRACKYPVELDGLQRVGRVTRPKSKLEPAAVFVSDAMAIIWQSIAKTTAPNLGRPLDRENQWRRDDYDAPARPKWRIKR